jgi:hypothetical protein
MKALVNSHFMKPGTGSGFLVLVDRLWLVEEVAPVVVVPVRYFRFLFVLIGGRTFGYFVLLPELGNPPLPDIGGFVWKLLQAFKDAQEVFRDMGAGFRLAPGNEGAETVSELYRSDKGQCIVRSIS